jgi:dUTP pyrophosphatase
MNTKIKRKILSLLGVLFCTVPPISATLLYFPLWKARSGLAAREGLRPANCVGVADSDYRGEYIVALHNDSSVDRIVTPGERIAQLVIMPFLSVEFEEAETLSETERGAGGFGSTGKV